MMIVDPYQARALAPVAVSYVGLTAVGSMVGVDTVSVPSVPIGAAAGDRMVFILVHWTSSTPTAAPLSSATIGGVTAKIHVNNGSVPGSGNLLGAAIISALVPTGTTATVGLTFVAGATFHNPFLETYRVTGIVSDTAIDTISAGPVGVQPYSGAIDVQKDGLLLFGATTFSAATSYTMTGATQDYDDIQGTSFHSVGGSLAVSADELNRAVSITRVGGAGSGFNAAVVAASFR